MRRARRILRLSAVVIAACNGYHLIASGARLVGLRALRSGTQFDPEDFARLFAEPDTQNGL